MKFLLRGRSPFGLFVAAGEDTTNPLRGVPGEVGRGARGAELMECDARLCVCELGLLDPPASGVDRVLVNVTLTEKGSPAKKAD